MDKLALLLTGLIVVMFSIIAMPDEFLMIADALYSIPPTPAWQNIGIADNQTFPANSESFIHANNSSDTFMIVTDGSIKVNITTFTP